MGQKYDKSGRCICDRKQIEIITGESRSQNRRNVQKKYQNSTRQTVEGCEEGRSGDGWIKSEKYAG